MQVRSNKTNLTFYPNCERKMIFITIRKFWELFVIESIPKCSTSFLIHREILSGLWYWLIIVYWKNNAILIVQWTMLFMSILPWKCNNKLLQKWILCQDSQIKSNHNHIYKHFILRPFYLFVTIKCTNTTNKYHFIENFYQNDHRIQLWIEDSFFKIKFFEITFMNWQISI